MMRLSTPQIETAVDQLQASAISDSATIASELTDLYGDHTFFVDPDGLHILEWFDEDQPGDGREVLSLIQLASWTDDSRTEVVTHEPRKTGKTVITGEAPSDPAA